MKKKEKKYQSKNPPPARVLFSAAKDLQETPEAETAQDGDGEIIIPAPEVDNFAGGADEAGPEAHDDEGEGAGEDGGGGGGDGFGRLVVGGEGRGERGKTKTAGEHEGSVRVVEEGLSAGGQPAPEGGGGQGADEGGGDAAGEGFAAAQAGRMAAVGATDRAGGGVAPAEQQHAHDTDVLGEELERQIRPEQVPDHAVPAVDLGLAHERPEHADVDPVQRREAVPQVVHREDRDQGREDVGR